MLDHNGPGHFGSSFALGFSEPNFVEKPTHPHQGRGSWRPNPRMRSQTSSRRTWPSCTSLWRPSWLGRRSLGRIGIRHGGGPGGSLGHPSGGKGEWPPGPGIPGWGERVQCPDLGLHGDAPPSGSPGGCQLGPGPGETHRERAPGRRGTPLTPITHLGASWSVCTKLSGRRS